ncbi:MAG: hypothetical protein AB7R89_23050 [Dehalococcoidia bacterium]
MSLAGFGGSAIATFYRIVKSDPPTHADFFSLARRTRPPTPDTYPERDPFGVLLYLGVSVYDRDDLARKMAQQIPLTGSFIAQLEFSTDGPIRGAKTTKRKGHYTLWGRPSDILDTVQWVSPVGDPSE